MKKILLISLLLTFILCTSVFADMSAPTIITYSAYVSNPDGATYYSSSVNEEAIGTVPFGTKIIISSYGSRDREHFILEGEKFNEDPYKYINASDYTIEDLSNYELGEKNEYMALNNAKIYSMPVANDDKVIGSIPNRTIITAQPYLADESLGIYNDWASWYYTSYNGVNGWINIDNIAIKEENLDKRKRKNLIYV